MKRCSKLSTVKLGLFLAAICLSIDSLNAEAVTLNSQDTNGNTSFNAAGNWSNGAAPSSGNTYSTAYTLRTPASAGNYTFAGDSLTLNTGGTLVYKGTGTGTDIIKVNNLYLNGGNISNSVGPYAFTLAGSIILQSLSNGFTSGSPINVAASISGTGKFNISSVTLTLSSANNTYSGGTYLNSASTSLTVQSAGALGAGNVIMNGGNLILQNNSTIADSANLVLVSTLTAGAVNLSFSGTETVGGLSLNGGSSYLTAGMYTISDLNTLYGSAVFTGTGQIQVIPEASTWAYLLSGLFLTLLGRRRVAHLCCSQRGCAS